MNKRGFELVWSTVVVMVIAFMLLLFFIVFFTGGAGSFVDNIKSYFSYSNVDSVIRSCNVLADTESSYIFCCESKEVKYYKDGIKTKGVFTCSGLLEEGIIEGGIRDFDCGELEC